MAINNRVWVGLAVVLMIGIVLLGVLLGVNPRLGEIAKNETDRQAALAVNASREAELKRLKSENEKIDEYSADLADLQRQLPPNNDLSTFLGELHELEIASGVVLTNFGSADAVPFQLDSGVAEADQGKDAVVQTLDPSEFVVIQIDLSVTGTQAQVLDFVEALQNGSRRFLVTGLTITTENGVYTGAISGYVYVLLDPRKPVVDEEAPVDPVVTPEPSATPTPTGSETPTPTSSATPTP